LNLVSTLRLEVIGTSCPKNILAPVHGLPFL